MARVAVPILRLKYDDQDAFDNQIYEMFEEEGVWNSNEEFTFTGRVSLGQGEDKAQVAAKQERIKARLHEMLQKDEAERLIKLLDDNDWDLSFYVDCW